MDRHLQDINCDYILMHFFGVVVVVIVVVVVAVVVVLWVNTIKAVVVVVVVVVTSRILSLCRLLFIIIVRLRRKGNSNTFSFSFSFSFSCMPTMCCCSRMPPLHPCTLASHHDLEPQKCRQFLPYSSVTAVHGCHGRECDARDLFAIQYLSRVLHTL